MQCSLHVTLAEQRPMGITLLTGCNTLAGLLQAYHSEVHLLSLPAQLHFPGRCKLSHAELGVSVRTLP